MTYVQLGKYGDLLSVLPMMQKGDRLVVSRDYASVLEGVSYVEPVVYDGPAYEIGKAVAANPGAKSIQINGPIDQTREFTYKPAGQTSAQTTSFQIESWHIAGKLAEWYKYPPLVFDKRDATREQALLDQWTPRPKWNRKKSVLFYSGGETSPFPHKKLLRELVRLVFDKPGYGIIDLEAVKAERIYDLLALYEQAHVLISTDSAPLHLARACPKLPVVAICNDKPLPWHGSAWQPNFIWYCRYGDFIERAHEVARIPDLINETEKADAVLSITLNGDKPFCEDEGWRVFYVWPGMTGRDSSNTVADAQKHPYLKDVMRMGLAIAVDSTYVVLSRSGVKFIHGLQGKTEPTYAYRMSRTGGIDTFSPVVDLFAAKASWWREHLKEIPDLIMGRDVFWSQCLWAMFKKYGAYDATGMVYRIPEEAKPEPTSTTLAPRLKHNIDLCTAYIATSGVKSRYPKVTEQVDTVPLATDQFFPFAYNPSIIDEHGGITMAYRYHPDGKDQSKVALVNFDANMQIIAQGTLQIPGRSIEDPKLFKYGDQIRISWVDSTVPDLFPHAIVRFGWLTGDKVKVIITPPIGRNDWTGLEKNWVFFESDILNCIYRCAPEHIVYGRGWTEKHVTPGPRWPYGEIRGGTVPIPYEGGLLRFFHSSVWKDMDGKPWRYYIGAYLMHDKPPFEVFAVSKKPIIYASESCGLNKEQRSLCKHYKTKIVFPGGAVVRGNEFWLSLGVNDSACCIARIKPEMLNL